VLAKETVKQLHGVASTSEFWFSIISSTAEFRLPGALVWKWYFGYGILWLPCAWDTAEFWLSGVASTAEFWLSSVLHCTWDGYWVVFLLLWRTLSVGICEHSCCFFRW